MKVTMRVPAPPPPAYVIECAEEELRYLRWAVGLTDTTGEALAGFTKGIGSTLYNQLDKPAR